MCCRFNQTPYPVNSTWFLKRAADAACAWLCRIHSYRAVFVTITQLQKITSAHHCLSDTFQGELLFSVKSMFWVSNHPHHINITLIRRDRLSTKNNNSFFNQCGVILLRASTWLINIRKCPCVTKMCKKMPVRGYKKCPCKIPKCEKSAHAWAKSAHASASLLFKRAHALFWSSKIYRTSVG